MLHIKFPLHALSKGLSHVTIWLLTVGGEHSVVWTLECCKCLHHVHVTALVVYWGAVIGRGVALLRGFGMYMYSEGLSVLACFLDLVLLMWAPCCGISCFWILSSSSFWKKWVGSIWILCSSFSLWIVSSLFWTHMALLQPDWPHLLLFELILLIWPARCPPL